MFVSVGKRMNLYKSKVHLLVISNLCSLSKCVAAVCWLCVKRIAEVMDALVLRIPGNIRLVDTQPREPYEDLVLYVGP